MWYNVLIILWNSHLYEVYILVNHKSITTWYCEHAQQLSKPNSKLIKTYLKLQHKDRDYLPHIFISHLTCPRLESLLDKFNTCFLRRGECVRPNDSPLDTACWLILTKMFLNQSELNPCRNQNRMYFIAIQILGMLHVTTYIYNIYNKYFTLLQ